MQLRAGALARLDLYRHALDAYDGVLAIDPNQPDTWRQRDSVLREAGPQAFEQAIARGGDVELNGYYLAAVRDDTPPPIAPAAYIEELFDDYSASFEAHLIGGLGYRGRDPRLPESRRDADATEQIEAYAFRQMPIYQRVTSLQLERSAASRSASTTAIDIAGARQAPTRASSAIESTRRGRPPPPPQR